MLMLSLHILVNAIDSRRFLDCTTIVLSMHWLQRTKLQWMACGVMLCHAAAHLLAVACRYKPVVTVPVTVPGTADSPFNSRAPGGRAMVCAK
jgi:hypothetical protein